MNLMKKKEIRKEKNKEGMKKLRSKYDSETLEEYREKIEKE